MKKYTIAECHQLFDDLFPHGFASRDIIDTLAPTGWENSQLFFAIHPTPEQVYKNWVSFDEFMVSLPSAQKREDTMPITWEEFLAEYEPSTEAPNPQTDIQELVAICAYEIFSDNIVVKNNKAYSLGKDFDVSGFIAEQVNKTSSKQYDDEDFYMGVSNKQDNCDFTPVYEFIFSRLKQAACDWIFRIPDFNFLERFRPENQIPWDEDENSIAHSLEHYNPNLAFEQELKQQAQQKKRDIFIAQMEALIAKEIEDLSYKAPPTIIQAYMNVFGKLPKGWPPV